MSEDHVVPGSGVTTRRALFAGAGAIGAGVVLAACGDDSSAGVDGSAGGPPTSGESTASGPVQLAKTSDIPVGGGVIFASHGVLVTQPTEGTFKGFSSTCTHQGCPIASIDGGMINCSCHGSQFSIENGSVKSSPAVRALPPRKINIEGDTITLG